MNFHELELRVWEFLLKTWGVVLTGVRAFRSRTVLTAVSGFGVHYCVRKGLIPDTFFSQALEGASYVLCAIFRVLATDNLQTGAPLK